LKNPGIFPYPGDTYINFTAYWLIRPGKREADDIGIKIVLKKLAVYFEQSIVGTENILQVSQFFPFPFKQGRQENLQLPPLFQGNILEKMKLYDGIRGWHFRNS
jgi:hypothetical protein